MDQQKNYGRKMKGRGGEVGVRQGLMHTNFVYYSKPRWIILPILIILPIPREYPKSPWQNFQDYCCPKIRRYK